MEEPEGLAGRVAELEKEVVRLSESADAYHRLVELLEDRVEHLEALTLGSRDKKRQRELWELEKRERRGLRGDR